MKEIIASRLWRAFLNNHLIRFWDVGIIPISLYLTDHQAPNEWTRIWISTIDWRLVSLHEETCVTPRHSMRVNWLEHLPFPGCTGNREFWPLFSLMVYFLLHLCFCYWWQPTPNPPAVSAGEQWKVGRKIPLLSISKPNNWNATQQRQMEYLNICIFQTRENLLTIIFWGLGISRNFLN